MQKFCLYRRSPIFQLGGRWAQRVNNSHKNVCLLLGISDENSICIWDQLTLDIVVFAVINRKKINSAVHKRSVSSTHTFSTICKSCCTRATLLEFVNIAGDETAQVGSADCKLSPVFGTIQRFNHTSRTESEGERPRPLPADCPKCSRKVGEDKLACLFQW